MAETLTARVENALIKVINRRTGIDVVHGEQIVDVATSTEGRVRITLELSAGDDPTLARDVRQGVEGVEGVTDVRVEVKRASGVADARSAGVPIGAPAAAIAAAPRRVPLPMMPEPAAAPKPTPAPTPVAFPALGKIIAISSGVKKSGGTPYFFWWLSTSHWFTGFFGMP